MEEGKREGVEFRLSTILLVARRLAIRLDLSIIREGVRVEVRRGRGLGDGKDGHGVGGNPGENPIWRP